MTHCGDMLGTTEFSISSSAHSVFVFLYPEGMRVRWEGVAGRNESSISSSADSDLVLLWRVREDAGKAWREETMEFGLKVTFWHRREHRDTKSHRAQGYSENERLPLRWARLTVLPSLQASNDPWIGKRVSTRAEELEWQFNGQGADNGTPVFFSANDCRWKNALR
ncbi:uncharacterized protein BDZ99DRAFT_461677 [Mytilinidion resinicola]|uniref:Uncharacterized protein n=1 Tax=Mytilinidion resinicola TaxID=574789 RepID=A0A6A6YRW3_9PEZI|nr:uncharacterized protein BDZ99DRAFT_461677 [Mytilinidion resinicola]KAF2811672.1 hypothetical protein BDZ99DRAFT_461677 [Mytilinidion resinicola]